MVQIEETRALIAAVASGIGLRVQVRENDGDIVVLSTHPHRIDTVTRAVFDDRTGDWEVTTLSQYKKPSPPRPMVADDKLVGIVLSEWVKQTASILVGKDER